MSLVRQMLSEPFDRSGGSSVRAYLTLDSGLDDSS